MYSAVNGTKLFFDTEGSLLWANGEKYEEKPTLIMLHGGPGSDHAYARPSLAGLSDFAYVVYLDQRNQGKSQREGLSGFSISKLAEDLNEFCIQNSIEKPFIFGHSFGGMVAIEYASKYQSNVSGVILASTFAKMHYASMFSNFERLGGHSAKKAAESFWLNPSLESLETYKKEAIFCTSKNWPKDIVERNKRCNPNSELCVNFWAGEGSSINLIHQVVKINCRVLLLAGDSDPVSPPECSQEIYSHISHGMAEMKLLQNCGHMFWYDQPEEGISAIEQFMYGEPSNA